MINTALTNFPSHYTSPSRYAYGWKPLSFIALILGLLSLIPFQAYAQSTATTNMEDEWASGSLTYNEVDVDGSGIDFQGKISGETSRLSVIEGGVFNGVAGLYLITDGFTSQGTTYTFSFNNPVTSVDFELGHLNATGVGDIVEISAKDGNGNAIPIDVTKIDFDNDGIYSYTISGNGTTSAVIDGMVNLSIDNAAVAISDSDLMSEISITWNDCTTCVEGGHGIAIGDFTFEYSKIDQCDPVASGNTDTDADGIANICDLDDDNDGILDVDERFDCETNQNPFANIPSEAVAAIDPTIAGATQSYSNFDITYYTNNAVASQYSINGMTGIEPDVPGVNVIYEFSKPLYNVDFAIADFDQDEIINLRVYDENGDLMPFETVSSSITLQGTYATHSSLSGHSLHIEVNTGCVWNHPNFNTGRYTRFYFSDIAISRIEIDYVSGCGGGSPDYWLFNACTESDADGDGTPDYLDTDSDNDGCPDALEGGGSFDPSDLDSDGSLGDNVDADGIPDLAGSPQATSADVTDASIASACAASCSFGSNTFTWEGSGFGNEATWVTGQGTGASTVTGCGTNDIVVDISIDNSDGVHYLGTQEGTGTNGSLGQPGLEIWMDEDNDLYNGVAMQPGEEVLVNFVFSSPIILTDLLIADIDSRDVGGLAGVSSSWQDQVTVTALDENGNDVPLITTSVGVAAGTIVLSNQTATAVWEADADRGLGVDDTDGQATWSSMLPISSLKVSYITGPDELAPGQQVIRISDFGFCCPEVCDIPPNAGTDGTLTVCEGSTPSNAELFAALDGTPDAGGTWSNDGLEYTYTVTAIAPCSVDATSKVTITEHAAPNAGTDGTLTVCEGTTPNNAELFEALGGAPDAGGTWSNVGLEYTYAVLAIAPCDVDAFASIILEEEVCIESVLDLSITKSVSNFQPEVGDNVTFNIALYNNGPDNAANVIVSELLPSGYEYISHRATIGVYNEFSGIWEVPAFDFTNVARLSITVEVLGYDDYLNIVTIESFDGGEDEDESDNSASAETEPICLTVYNEFSPNGDGTNEHFVIDCIENYPNNTIEIFNRWGNTVYVKTGYDNSWDGTSNGKRTINGSKELPVGTYYYVLDLGDGSESKSGWIYLNR